MNSLPSRPLLHRLACLPRDSRDTLFLLAVIAWVLLPHAAHLPLWCSALAGALLAWRGWLALSLRPLPARWLVLGALVLAVGATLATHRTLLGRDAGVTLLAVLLALKTLELRARRDAFVVFFLGFFTMLTNFFYSQSLLTAAAMLLALLGLLTALVNSHLPAGRPSLGQSARLAGRMMLLGAPIMVLLFVFFPRLAPLWGTPNDALAGRSGLAQRMQIGNIANLALDESVALRVRFEDKTMPPRSALYFRGPVLATFDGREWSPLQPTFASPWQPRANLQVSGPSLRYEVTLEPHNRPWLLTLDAAINPPQLPGGQQAHMSEDLQWQASAPVRELLRYQAQSYPSFLHGPLQPISGLQDYLSLPQGYNPRTLQWAQTLLREAEQDPAQLIQLVLQHLRSDGYLYTLEPGVFGEHTADEFWFERKQGFCEHIASSFVVLMRAAGVPARIVTGYQGGELNGLDGYWVVRQSDAHAWAEVWLAGQGWLRVDPTTAVAPARTGSLQRLLAPRGVLATAVGTMVGPNVLQSMRTLWGAVNNAWNQQILNYSQGRQFALLRAMGYTAPSWEDLARLLASLLAAASLLGALWAYRRRPRLDPWLRLLERMRHQLQRRYGLNLGAAVTPQEMAARIGGSRDPQNPQVQAVQAWLRRFEQLRYAPRAGHSAKVDLALLQGELRKLRWPV